MNKMKNYKIKKYLGSSPFSDSYTQVVYSLTETSPLNDILFIEAELAMDQYKGKVLFDMFMCNATPSGRYIEAMFDGYAFDYTSFHIIEGDSLMKKESMMFYMTEPGILEKVILPIYYKESVAV